MELYVPVNHSLPILQLTQYLRKIETMIKFCQPDQPAARDRHLLRHIIAGEDIVKECTDLINEIKESFDNWSIQTKAICIALGITSGKIKQ